MDSVEFTKPHLVTQILILGTVLQVREKRPGYQCHQGRKLTMMWLTVLSVLGCRLNVLGRRLNVLSVLGCQLNVLSVLGRRLNVLSALGCQLNVLSVLGCQLNVLSVLGCRLSVLRCRFVSLMSSEDVGLMSSDVGLVSSDVGLTYSGQLDNKDMLMLASVRARPMSLCSA